MDSHPAFTYTHITAIHKFSELRINALRDKFLAKLTGRISKLAAFPEDAQRNRPNRKLVGINDVDINRIIGSFNRQCDFDGQFRPLEHHLLERWVNIFTYLNPDSWEPILLHKIGEQYYVEDGHHRVSVARSMGKQFILAKVWEYPQQQKRKDTHCQHTSCVEKRPVKAAGGVAG